MNTEEKIVAKALEMFNARGVEYVGLRELAAILGMRVSNITYYFPTKDDLVNRLSLDLNRLNSQIVLDNHGLTLEAFLEMLHAVFQNHLRYRCLLLSFVHLMEQNKLIAERYKQTEDDRNATLRANLQSLVQEGYLSDNGEQDLAFLVSTIALIVRFWISESAVSYRHRTETDQIHHYLSLIARLLYPYATVRGKQQLQTILEKFA